MSGAGALQYKNRKGQVYYLQQGKTPTGKPKYYAGTKVTGTPMAALPDGYEFYERPENAQVIVRAVKPSSITEIDRKQVEEIVRRDTGLEHFVVEIDGDSIVVHTPGVTSAETDKMLSVLAGVFQNVALPTAQAFREYQVKQSQYQKMLRFTLADLDKREFRAERWRFFRGSAEAWFPLVGRGSLTKVVEAYAKHLDEESFFEQI